MFLCLCRVSELTGHSKNIIWPLGCLPLWSDSVNRASVELGDFKSGSSWRFLPPVIPAFKRVREKDHFWVQGQPKLGGPLQKEGTQIWVGMCPKRMLLCLVWTKNRWWDGEASEKLSKDGMRERGLGHSSINRGEEAGKTGSQAQGLQMGLVILSLFGSQVSLRSSLKL